MSAASSTARRPTADGTGDGSVRVLAPIVLTAASAIGTCLVAAAVVAGGATPLLLARAGTRVLLDLSAATVLGVLAVVLLLLPDGDSRRRRALDVAAVAAAVWTVAAAATAFLLYLGQAPSVSSPAFGPGLVTFLADVVPGRTWLIATTLAAVLTTGLVAVRSNRGLQLLALLAAAALIPVAAQSAPSDESLAGVRTVGAAAFVVLVAVGTWIGSTAVVAVLRRPALGRRGTGIAAVSGTAAVAALALGGVQPLPLGLPAAVVLVLALGSAVAVRQRGARGLLLLQCVLLGIATGLAAAARVARSAPASAGTRTTPAEILTGAPLPGAPTLELVLVAWQADALWLLLAAGLLGAQVGLVGRLRRRGTHLPVGRITSWSLGVLLLVWLTCGAPAVYAPVLLSAHLAQHVGLLTAVPLLLAGGAPRRLLPANGSPVAAAPRGIGVLGRPIPAAGIAVVAFVALYGTGMLRWSVTDAVGTEWALLQCLLTGALLVLALATGTRRTAVAVSVTLLLVETAVAAVPALGPGLLLPDWFGAMGWGTDARVDQRLGAVLAWGIAIVFTLVLLGLVTRRRAGAPPPGRASVPASPTPRLEVSA